MPTAFAGYSFHVAEAALVFADYIVEIFLLPIHAGLHRAYHLFTTLIHMGATFAVFHHAVRNSSLREPGCTRHFLKEVSLGLLASALAGAGSSGGRCPEIACPADKIHTTLLCLQAGSSGMRWRLEASPDDKSHTLPVCRRARGV